MPWRKSTTSLSSLATSVLSGGVGLAQLASAPSFTLCARSLYRDARKIARSGRTLPRTVHKRQRYKREAIDEFVHYVTGPNVMVGLSWGGRYVEKSEGSTVWLQQTLVKLIPAEIIRGYRQYLSDNGKEVKENDLPDSTIYHILSKVMHMKTRMPSSCVDQFVVEAESGWNDIGDLADELHSSEHIDAFELNSFKQMIRSSRSYLRGDYKAHVQESSRVPDHCQRHALSDNTRHHGAQPFLAKCDHDHSSQKCMRCDVLDALFNEMTTVAAELMDDTEASKETKEVMEVALARIALTKKRIMAFKAHQMRAVHAEQERSRIVQSLRSGQALCTIDFAQKYLPNKHMLTQSEGYGRAGFSWHISHCLANISGHLAQHSFTHILGYDIQDSTSVTLVLQQVFEKLKNASITGVHVRSDNGAYYHSGSTISSLAKIAPESGVALLSYSFCEAQSGKGAADRESSRMKTHVFHFLKRQTDASTWSPFQFFFALQSSDLRGASFHLVSITNRRPAKFEINGIRKYFHFDYHEDSDHVVRKITAYRYKGIGDGMAILPKDNSGFAANGGNMKLEGEGGQLTPPHPDKWEKEPDNGDYWLLYRNEKTKKKHHDADDEAEEREHEEQEGNGHHRGVTDRLLRCPEEGCRASFILQHNQDRHVDKGKHYYEVDHVSMDDYVLDQAVEAIQMNDIRAESLPIVQAAIEKLNANQAHKVKEGAEASWANPTTPERTEVAKLDKDVVDFLQGMYKLGETHREYRYAPELTEEKMRKETKDNKRRFKPSQWLTAAQIGSYFRRCYQKEHGGRARRSLDPDDLTEIHVDPDVTQFQWEEVWTQRDAIEAIIAEEGVR